MTAEHEFDIIRDSLDHCVKCTICESACPVAAVTPLFPGPKYVGPQAERFRDAGPSVDASLDYCSSCGICTLACPQGVHVAEINSRARAVMKAQKGMPLRDHILSRPEVQGMLGTPVAPLANFALSNRLGRLLAEKSSASTVTPRRPSSPAVPSSAGHAATPRRRPRRSRSCTSTAAARTTSSPGWAA